MALHLFDKPDTGPTLNELLVFWGGKLPEFIPFAPVTRVWLLTTIDCTERGPDSYLGARAYPTQAHALQAYWLDKLDTAMSDPDYFDEHLTPTTWLADCLTEMQSLRDEGEHYDGDFMTVLAERPIG